MKQLLFDPINIYISLNRKLINKSNYERLTISKYLQVFI